MGNRWAILGVVFTTFAIAVACSSEFAPDSSTPTAAVRTYLGHLSRGEATDAYNLLAVEARQNCLLQEYLNQAAQFQQELDNSRVVVKETNIVAGRATVQASVNMGRVDVGPFGPRSSSFDVEYVLVQEASGWRLTQTGWPWTPCNVYRSPDIKPIPPPVTETPTPTPTVVVQRLTTTPGAQVALRK